MAEGAAAGGTPISESFIHLLRSGARDNPTKKHLEGIARYFGIPAACFFDDTGESRRVHEELTSKMSPAMRRWLIDTFNGLAIAQDTGDPGGDG